MRKTYTGKLYGKQDDLCVAVQLAVIGQSKFFQDSKYRNFRSLRAALMRVRAAGYPTAALLVRIRERRTRPMRLTRFDTQAWIT